jgi:hypothetical protein
MANGKTTALAATAIARELADFLWTIGHQIAPMAENRELKPTASILRLSSKDRSARAVAIKPEAFGVPQAGAGA